MQTFWNLIQVEGLIDRGLIEDFGAAGGGLLERGLDREGGLDKVFTVFISMHIIAIQRESNQRNYIFSDVGTSWERCAHGLFNFDLKKSNL